MVCEAIHSVYAQQWPDLEVVVVDDGSVDGSGKEVATRYPEVKLVRLSGLGPGPARNAGVDAASGDVIMFLDSDDLWLSGHVQGLLAVLERGFEVAYGVARTVNLVDDSTFCVPEADEVREGKVLSDLVRWCFLVPSALAITRKAFNACGGFRDYEFGEDWWFLLQLAARFDFGFAGATPITDRRLHDGSICAQADRQTIHSFLNRLHREMLNESWCKPEMAERFSILKEWVRNQKNDWATVQDWYLAMREEGMV